MQLGGSPWTELSSYWSTMGPRSLPNLIWVFDNIQLRFSKTKVTFYFNTDTKIKTIFSVGTEKWIDFCAYIHRCIKAWNWTVWKCLKKGLEFDCYFKMVLNPFCNLTQTTILPLLLWENGKEDKFPQMLFDHHSSCLHFLFVDVRARWRAARVEISWICCKQANNKLC